MKIGIISDIHGNAVHLKKAIDFFIENNIRTIICAGDWGMPDIMWFYQSHFPNSKTYTILGNAAAEPLRYYLKAKKRKLNIEIIDELGIIEIDKRKICIYHGVSKLLNDSLAKSEKFDLLITGHDHIANIDTINKTIHINPGTLSNCRMTKFNNDYTIAIYDTKKHEGEIIEL